MPGSTSAAVAPPVTRAVSRAATSIVYGAIRKSKIGVHGIITVEQVIEQARTIAGERRGRTMFKNLPGEAVLRALLRVVSAGDDWEPELHGAVGALRDRARAAEAERQSLYKLPECATSELISALEGLEGAYRGFCKALEIYVLDPARNQSMQPPEALMATVGASLVCAEFRVACSRMNMKGKEDDHGNSVH